MKRATSKRLAGWIVAAVAAMVVGGCAMLAQSEPPPGKLVKVQGPDGPVNLYVEEDGHGQPILLLHGFGGSTQTWRRVKPELARTHRVIAIDLKGFGRSDKPFDDDYGPLDQAALIKAFIDQRRLANLTLGGHSLGGGVALALALDLNRTRPGLLKRLILIDSPAYRQPLPPAVSLLATPILGALTITLVPPEILTKSAMFAAYQKSAAIEMQDVMAYARPLYEPGGKLAVLRTAEQIVPPDLEDLVRRYPTIMQPTLLVWCRRDKVVPLVTGTKLAKDLPNARLEILDSCDHVPQEEVPAEFLRTVRGFLRSN